MKELNCWSIWTKFCLLIKSDYFLNKVFFCHTPELTLYFSVFVFRWVWGQMFGWRKLWMFFFSLLMNQEATSSIKWRVSKLTHITEFKKLLVCHWTTCCVFCVLQVPGCCVCFILKESQFSSAAPSTSQPSVEGWSLFELPFLRNPPRTNSIWEHKLSF